MKTVFYSIRFTALSAVLGGLLLISGCVFPPLIHVQHKDSNTDLHRKLDSIEKRLDRLENKLDHPAH